MTEKILEYRTAKPDQLKLALDSILSSQRPNLPHIDDGLESGPSADSKEMELDEEPRTDEKIRLVKGKIPSNISAMPVVLRTLVESMEVYM
ncbi:uncharacterized protein LOC120199597 isoform X2 [Hibiscus syriacus]|uniref:uncharacterized protein LOC120199597 isoform X2 n=1 Tax=Hibiscus syriacus TaxID=106335 RepID=UPI0019206893|nr:uncharacterized protein LOC120199597 isoform X2 [Hibiscus syriacus]